MDNDKWICKHCGQENEENFCIRCGGARNYDDEVLEWFCPKCGKKNNDLFCDKCGTRKPINIDSEKTIIAKSETTTQITETIKNQEDNSSQNTSNNRAKEEVTKKVSSSNKSPEKKSQGSDNKKFFMPVVFLHYLSLLGSLDFKCMKK